LNQLGKPITVPLNPPLKNRRKNPRKDPYLLPLRQFRAVMLSATTNSCRGLSMERGFPPGVVMHRATRRPTTMSNIKTLAIAAALLVGASSLAMAQSTQNNAGASGGPGTHAGAMKSGSAESNQKVQKNQNGYAPGQQ
jgi:hypothetical protein